MAKKMEDQKFYMTITAVVAIVAVVGLIMMFGLKKPLGEEVVGKGTEVTSDVYADEEPSALDAPGEEGFEYTLENATFKIEGPESTDVTTSADVTTDTVGSKPDKVTDDEADTP